MPGWYPDPEDESVLVYWDGSEYQRSAGERPNPAYGEPSDKWIPLEGNSSLPWLIGGLLLAVFGGLLLAEDGGIFGGLLMLAGFACIGVGVIAKGVKLGGTTNQGADPSPPPSSPASPSLAEQLSQLAALHESGALSDAEFEAAKRAALGNL